MSKITHVKNFVGIYSIVFAVLGFVALIIDKTHEPIIHILLTLFFILGVIVHVPFLLKIHLVSMIVMGFLHGSLLIMSIIVMFHDCLTGLFGFGLFILPLVVSIVYFVMYSNDKKKQKNLSVAALDSNNTKESNTLNDELNALLASKNRGEITEEEYLAKKKDLIGY